MREETLIDALRALAHPLRWRILAALATGERNVGDIEEVTGIGQPALSQQLGVLRKAELVETRREAKLVFYAIAPGTMAALRDAVSGLIRDPLPAVTVPEEMHAPAPGVANFARIS